MEDEVECSESAHGFHPILVILDANHLVWLILIGSNRRSCLHLLITSVSGDSISCEQLRQIDGYTMCLKYSPVTTCDRISSTGGSLIL